MRSKVRVLYRPFPWRDRELHEVAPLRKEQRNLIAVLGLSKMSAKWCLLVRLGAAPHFAPQSQPCCAAFCAALREVIFSI